MIKFVQRVRTSKSVIIFPPFSLRIASSFRLQKLIEGISPHKFKLVVSWMRTTSKCDTSFAHFNVHTYVFWMNSLRTKMMMSLFWIFIAFVQMLRSVHVFCLHSMHTKMKMYENYAVDTIKFSKRTMGSYVPYQMCKHTQTYIYIH